MILKVDTDILGTIKGLTLNQLVLLNFVGNNQIKNQSLRSIVSQIDETETQNLIDNGYLEKDPTSRILFKPTEKLLQLFEIETTKFDEFCNIYPKMVTRNDGLKCYLHTNMKRCRKIYNQLLKDDPELHELILKCLNDEISHKLTTGKMNYFSTMWLWLTRREWERYITCEEETKTEESYGTNIEW